MSYILDALRRADAERERGRVPGLHTQMAPPGTAEPKAARGARRSRGPLLLGLGVLAAAIAGTAWWLMRDGMPAPAPSPAPLAQAPSAAPALVPEPPPAPPRAGTAPAPAAQAPAAPVQPILAPPPPPPPPAAPPPAPAPSPAPSAAPAPARAPTSPAASHAAAPRPANASAATGDANLPRVNDLNPTARAALPPLKLSGSTYADNPALRMLIVDGQVVQEGQDIAPGLKLESIGPRSAIVVHQGQRLRLPY